MSKARPRKESETFDEPSFLNMKDTDLQPLDLDIQTRSFLTSDKGKTDSEKDPNSL